ncbi:hypothetical protein PanWU01x14_293410, partial [Parasponia andersonii]
MKLRLPEVSKTEVRQCSGDQKTSPEADFLRGRYGFIRRRNEARLVALDSSSKAFRYGLAYQLRRVAVWWL